MTVSHFKNLSNSILVGESLVSTWYFNKPGVAGEKKNVTELRSFTCIIFYSDKVYWAIMKSLFQWCSPCNKNRLLRFKFSWRSFSLIFASFVCSPLSQLTFIASVCVSGTGTVLDTWSCIRSLPWEGVLGVYCCVTNYLQHLVASEDAHVSSHSFCESEIQALLAFYFEMSYKAAVEMPARPGTSHLKAQLVKDLRVSSRMCLLVKFSTLSGFAPRASVPCWLLTRSCSQ